MEQSEKAKQLAKKLLEVAKRGGTDGEKMNAQKLLESHLAKHNMTLADIESDDLKTYFWAVSSGIEMRFFRQIIASVIGTAGMEICNFRERDIDRRVHRVAKNKKVFSFDVTPGEFMLISQRMNFFWDHYDAEFEIFFSAYIQKNELYANPERKIARHQKSLSFEERERLERMMRSIDKTRLPGDEKGLKPGLALGDGMD